MGGLWAELVVNRWVARGVSKWPAAGCHCVCLTRRPCAPHPIPSPQSPSARRALQRERELTMARARLSGAQVKPASSRLLPQCSPAVWLNPACLPACLPFLAACDIACPPPRSAHPNALVCCRLRLTRNAVRQIASGGLPSSPALSGEWWQCRHVSEAGCEGGRAYE